MRRRLVLAGLAGALLVPAPASKADTVFRVGVAPHTSARIIIEMYQPLRLHLERTLNRPVEIVTAADFTEFARRAIQQEYDLAITTGHQARLFQTDAGYLPLLTYRADFRAVVLVAADSPYRHPRDLAGTTVYGLSQSSLVTLWGTHWLLRNAVPGVSLRYVSAADSVVQVIVRGEGSGAFTSLANYHALAPALQAQLRILDESPSMVGRVYLLADRHRSQLDRVRAGLWTFADTPEAKQFFSRYRLDGYRALEPRELPAMEPYAAEVRQMLRHDANRTTGGRSAPAR